MAQSTIHLPESVIEILRQAGISVLVQSEGHVYWVRDPYRFGTSFVKDLSSLINVDSIDLDDVVPDPDPPTPVPGPTEEDLAWERLFFETDVMGGLPITTETMIPEEMAVEFHLGALENLLVEGGQVHIIATTLQSSDRNRVDEGIDHQISGTKYMNRLPIPLGTNPRRLPIISTLAWCVESPADLQEFSETVFLNAREVLTFFIQSALERVDLFDDSWLIGQFSSCGQSVHRNGNVIFLGPHAVPTSLEDPTWSYHRVFVYDDGVLLQHHQGNTVESISLSELQTGGPFELVNLSGGQILRSNGTQVTPTWYHRTDVFSGNVTAVPVGHDQFYISTVQSNTRYVLCEIAPNELDWVPSDGSPDDAVTFELRSVANPLWDGNLRPLSVSCLWSDHFARYLIFKPDDGGDLLHAGWGLTLDLTHSQIAYLMFPDEYLVYPNVSQY